MKKNRIIIYGVAAVVSISLAAAGMGFLFPTIIGFTIISAGIMIENITIDKTQET